MEVIPNDARIHCEDFWGLQQGTIQVFPKEGNLLNSNIEERYKCPSWRLYLTIQELLAKTFLGLDWNCSMYRQISLYTVPRNETSIPSADI